jgi:uncharacterized protein (DUF302 family)
MFQKNSVTSRILIGAMVLALVGFTGSISAATPAGPGVQQVVPGSLDQALDKLRKAVADGGMMVMGELHQGKVLAMTGLQVQSETVFVGNPNVGKGAFSAEPGAGLVLPIRVNLYVNTEGKTVVSYIPPSQELAAFHNPKLDEVAKMLDQKLAMLVQMLAK